MSTISRKPVTHNLKIWPEYYAAVCTGDKRAELRWNDRDYQTGDILDLCEWDPNEEVFTGEFTSVTVTHVAELGQGMLGYVLLSIVPVVPETAESEMLKRLAIILSGSDAPGEIRSLTVTAQSFVDRCKVLAKERDECRMAMLRGKTVSQPVWDGSMPDTSLCNDVRCSICQELHPVGTLCQSGAMTSAPRAITNSRLSELRQHPELITRDEVLSLLWNDEPDAYHTVAYGDTLTTIALQYLSSVKELVALNPQIKDLNLIRPDDRIRLR
ncbi:DUF3850 domain-containing protein [Enterobacter soli]|uniref:DUF3850 domain-containing protein n=1 Tax=Enterobacter soli TaxID=885040 RepID=UPI002F4058ED